MRHHPKRPPYKAPEPVTLPRVRKLSRGVHFGLACVGFLFLGMIAFWIWGSGVFLG